MKRQALLASHATAVVDFLVPPGTLYSVSLLQVEYGKKDCIGPGKHSSHCGGFVAFKAADCYWHCYMVVVTLLHWFFFLV